MDGSRIPDAQVSGRRLIPMIRPPSAVGSAGDLTLGAHRRGLDRGATMTSLTTTQLARGLLERDDLIQMLDRAVAKRVTVVSAPPGSGKTSLLRACANRSTDGRRVAFVSVERDEGDAQRFWSAVLDAIRSPESPIDPETQIATTAELEGDEGVESVLAEVAEHVEPVVLIIDDLHELKSADALSQLERLIADLPSSARVVLSSRRDPPLRLHQL